MIRLNLETLSSNLPNNLSKIVKTLIIKSSQRRIKSSQNCVRFEVTMKNSVIWDVTPCGSCKNRRFGGT
jgi:hypothetical protein